MAIAELGGQIRKRELCVCNSTGRHNAESQR